MVQQGSLGIDGAHCTGRYAAGGPAIDLGGVHLADNMVKGLRAAVGFMTHIPVSIQEGDYDCFLSRVYLFIPVGLLIGLLIGSGRPGLPGLLPPSFAAALADRLHIPADGHQPHRRPVGYG